MVRPSIAEIADLMRVAREIRDTTDENGYRVDAAVRQHEAFSRTRGPASTLERSLVLDGARRGASQAGLSFEEVSGGLDIVTASGVTIRRYRVKVVKLTADGDYIALCGAGSSLLVAEPTSLMREERWLLGYLMSDDHTADRVIAAEVVGWSGTGPVRLTLGPIIDLNDNRPPPSFISTDESLPGFEDDHEDEEDGGTGEASGF